MRKSWSVIAALLALAFAYYVAQNEPYAQEFQAKDVAVAKPETDSHELGFDRTEVWFPSGGLQCHAWLYTPKDPPNNGAPVVVMGHGFGAQKDFGLEPYARDFANNGIAAFAFDYRHWGGSQGKPRHLIEVPKQQEDWFAALDFVLAGGINKAVQEYVVDPSKLAIWGSSFAGGHVIAVASTYHAKDKISAAISQVPYSDGVHSLPAILMQKGPVWALKLTANALKDMARNLVGMPRHYMPILDETIAEKKRKSFAKSGQTPILGTSECNNYWDLIPEQALGGWQNKVPATIGLTFPMYRPVVYASGVKAPTLGIYADGDSLCPVKGVKAMFAKIPTAEMRHLLGGHFDAYPGMAAFDQVVTWEREFLVKHLLGN